MNTCEGQGWRLTDLQDAALDHNLHPIGGYTGDLVDGIFEDGRGLIWIERDVERFTGVFDVDSEWSHRE